jgi:putative serine/threonine protein kinase
MEKKLDYRVVKKIGEGNRGEVYLVELEGGGRGVIKWAKNYDIDKEWEILNYLNGRWAPKPIYRGRRYFIMELVEGKPLGELIGTPLYYRALYRGLEAGYHLDRLGVFHKQLGRFYHIIYNPLVDQVKFIDFERGVFTNKPRNFLQILGYYLYKDANFGVEVVERVKEEYKKSPLFALSLLKEYFSPYFP